MNFTEIKHVLISDKGIIGICALVLVVTGGLIFLLSSEDFSSETSVVESNELILRNFYRIGAYGYLVRNLFKFCI